MATRRMNGAVLDHGAQFFTTRGGYFKDRLPVLVNEGACVNWHENRFGATRYRGDPGMTAVAKHFAQALDIRKQHLAASLDWTGDLWQVHFDNGEVVTAKTLLSTAPMPQAIALIDKSGLEMDEEQLREMQQIEYEPTIAMLMTLKSASTMQAPGILQFEDHPVLSTITDNLVKGISPIPAITLHSSHAFARQHIETMNAATADAMIEAAMEFAEFDVDDWKLHRWRYAQCVVRHPENFMRLKDYPLWLAGDGFGNARLEQAADSGLEAANDILRQV